MVWVVVNLPLASVRPFVMAPPIDSVTGWFGGPVTVMVVVVPLGPSVGLSSTVTVGCAGALSNVKVALPLVDPTVPVTVEVVPS